MVSHAMRRNCRHEQNRNDRRQEPHRADSEPRRERRVNATDGDQRQQRLPARFRLIDAIRRNGHTPLIARILFRRERSLLILI